MELARLTLAKNITFNIVNEKTTVGLMKALSDMYEKPSAANKVYLMRRLFNLKMVSYLLMKEKSNRKS